jgi:peptidyl-prolyl cis-trans isomerase SurA
MRLSALACLAALPALMAVPAVAANAPPPEAAEATPGAQIAAVVNGDVISTTDVANRGRLFALTTGLPLAPDVLARLSPQITRQLVDERLRLQEIQRRKIIVADKEIAAAIADVEQRNGMPAGTLRGRLAKDGVAYRTLVDQIRVQIGWTRVLRQQLGAEVEISPADVTEAERVLKAQTGQPEYRISEIFIPIETSAAAAEAQSFADTVIQELHAGAPFPVVAAQFSQSQTALQGGDLGWVQPSQLDPEVLRVLSEMPVGAVTNPVRVPGGLDIVMLGGKRAIGNDPATLLSVRQAFLPFSSTLDPQNPSAQQRAVLAEAQKLAASAHDCDTVAAAGKAAGSLRPVDPGDVRLENVPPAMRTVLDKLTPGKASQPLVSPDGILIIMVCSREQRNLGIPTQQEITARLLNERIELASRQLMQDLQRRALLDQRS